MSLTRPPAECTFCTLCVSVPRLSSLLANSSLPSRWIYSVVIPSLGTGRWRGRSIPHAGLGSSYPSARPRRTSCVRNFVDRHLAAGVLPDAARWTTTHAADRQARTGGPGAKAASADSSSQALSILIPVWWRRRPQDSWHVTWDNGFSYAAVFSQNWVWPYYKAYIVAVAPIQVTWIEFRVANRNFEYSNFVQHP